MVTVVIGVDPHKASHTAVAINAAEEPLGELRVRASAVQAKTGGHLVVLSQNMIMGWPCGVVSQRRSYQCQGAPNLKAPSYFKIILKCRVTDARGECS